ncbi:hypothetical protein B0H13DRAFT_2418725 [Mycena leptocephala]|nr:hypothetical protein B0H13DRAFT_2418725 [Mycena leptocephala]
MRALTWTPESMPDLWAEFEGASSLSSFKCEPRRRVVIGGRKEARVRAGMGWGGRGRDYVPHTHIARVPPRHSTASASRRCWFHSQQPIPARPPLFLYRYRFEPDLLRLLLSLSCPPNARHPSRHPAPTLAVHSYSALLALHLQMHSTILPAAHPRSAPRRCPVCAAFAARMHTPSTARAPAFPRPSRSIFALVVQAYFPLPCLHTRSTCSSPGARALMRDPPLTACRHPRCCMPFDLTPLSLRVRSELYGPSVPRRIDAHTFRSRLSRLSSGSSRPSLSLLRLAEPACIPSHLYPNRASSTLSAQSCSSSCSGLCAAFHSLDSAS